MFSLSLLVLSACYVTDAELTEALDRDGDGFLPIQAGGDDCDETRADIHPAADEVCGDGLDNNCDGVPDDRGVGEREWYLDGDGDNFGIEETVMACTRPEGYAPSSGDCDDANAQFRPGVTDADCDGLDQDCDGIPDDEIPLIVRYRDSDEDGFGTDEETTESCLEVPGFVSVSGDCDDTDRSISPAAEDFCDGLDQDCDGIVDDDAIFGPIYVDADGDGFGVFSTSQNSCLLPVGFAVQAGDCNDADGYVNPLAADLCNGIDQDCDGEPDDDSPLISYYQDLDGDGAGNSSVGVDSCAPVPGFSVVNGDCDDTDSSISPLLEDDCDGVNNDCDGETDEDAVRTLYYEDADGDASGSPDTSILACMAPPGFVLDSTDCDDEDGDVEPGNFDFCDGKDQDCDGSIDEDETFVTYFRDADGDGIGSNTVFTSVCGALPAGFVAVAGDCDDTDATVQLPTWYLDGDGDGHGSQAATQGCTAPINHVASNDDCDDNDPDRAPSNTEICQNLLDDDCDDSTRCQLPPVSSIFGFALPEPPGVETFEAPQDADFLRRIGDVVGDSTTDLIMANHDDPVWFKVVDGATLDFMSQTNRVDGFDCRDPQTADLLGNTKLDLICDDIFVASVWVGGGVLDSIPYATYEVAGSSSAPIPHPANPGIWFEGSDSLKFMPLMPGLDQDVESLHTAEILVDSDTLGTVECGVNSYCVVTSDGPLLTQDILLFEHQSTGIRNASQATYAFPSTPDRFLIPSSTAFDFTGDSTVDLGVGWNLFQSAFIEAPVTATSVVERVEHPQHGFGVMAGVPVGDTDGDGLVDSLFGTGSNLLLIQTTNPEPTAVSTIQLLESIDFDLITTIDSDGDAYMDLFILDPPANVVPGTTSSVYRIPGNGF